MKLKNDLISLDPQLREKILEVANYVKETDSASEDYPTWYDSKAKKIDEVEYCEWFIRKHPLKYVGSLFYDIDGLFPEEKLRKAIVDDLKFYVRTNIVRKANQIIDALRCEAYCEELPKDIDRVHFKNGTFYIDGGFVPEKQFCANRLPVNYNAETKKPDRWLKFFDELGVKKLPKVKELNAEYAEVLAEKKKLYGEYRQVKKDMQEIQRAKYDIDQFFKSDEEQKKERVGKYNITR